MRTTTTDVLVVGAGPAGLATAVSALRHGARVLVVERRPDTSSIPRATGISTRTMEIFRTWGLDGAVRAGAVDCDPRIAVGTTLVDDAALSYPFSYPGMREALAVSPAHPAVAPQDHVEPMLAAEVRRLGGRIRFGTPLRDLRVGRDGVRADLGGGGRVRARFVVGADGPRSTVRAALGIAVEHLGAIGDYVQMLFRADLAERLGHRPPAISFLHHPDAPGVLLPVGFGRWEFAHGYDPARGESPADYTPERWRTLIRTATGMPDLEPQLLGALPFTMAADVAVTFRSGPGFLVGDAAHRMTPVAGIGMNTAIHDGHELGWKLAWVVRGLAGEALLDSHEAERGPAGRANAARSLLRDDPHPSDGLPADLGRTYRSPVVAAADEPPPYRTDRAARPGERAPHVWVQAGGRRCSTIDLFADRLTLLVGGGVQAEGAGAGGAGTAGGAGWERAAGRLPVTVRRPRDWAWAAAAAISAPPLVDAVAMPRPPVQVLVTGRDLTGPRLAETYRLGNGSAVLVRPDGIVAWRHDGACADPDAALADAVAVALGHAVPAASVTSEPAALAG